MKGGCDISLSWGFVAVLLKTVRVSNALLVFLPHNSCPYFIINCR